MFDVGNHFAVVVGLGNIEYDKAVERVTVFRRMDLGIDDAVPGTREEADDAGEQVGLVFGIDEDLQAFAFLVKAGTDDWLVVEYPVMQ